MTRSVSLPLVLMLSALAPLITPLHAQSTLPSYSPSTGRYRLTSSMKQTQEMMGQSQEILSSSNQLSTVTVAKDGQALSLTMVIDSASATMSAPMPAPDLSAIIGSTLVGAMALDGLVTTSTVTDKAGKPMDPTMALAMRSFLPRLKVGATAGTMWSDTTKSKGLQNGANVSSTTVINYTFVGDTTVAGVRGWKLTSTSTGTIDGTGSQGGADFSVKGTLTGQGTLVVGVNGIFVGGSLTVDTKMVVDVPMASMQIPITQQMTSTISRLP